MQLLLVILHGNLVANEKIDENGDEQINLTDLSYLIDLQG